MAKRSLKAQAKEEREAAFVAAAMCWGDRMAEVSGTRGDSASASALDASVAQGDSAIALAMSIKDEIAAQDRYWRSFFRRLLDHKHGGVVLLAASAIARTDRAPVMKALKRISRSRDWMLSRSAKLALGCCDGSMWEKPKPSATPPI